MTIMSNLGKACVVVGAALSLFAAGCAEPTPASTQPAEKSTVDRHRALLKLADITPKPIVPQAVAVIDSAPVEGAERHLRKAREQFDDQLWSEAISSAQKALQLDPKLVDARLLLARAAMRHGNNGLAETHLLEVLKYRPREPAAYQMLGEIAWQNGKTSEAIESLRIALLVSTDSPERPERILSHLTLAVALRKDGYLAAAVEQLDAFLAAAENPTPAMNAYRELSEVIVLYRGKAAGLIGEIQTQLGRYDLAAKAYERAVAQAPDDAPLKVRWVQSLAHAGRFDAALEVVRKIIATAPEDAGGLALLREVCDAAKQPQRYDAELVQMAKSTRSDAMRLQLAELLIARDKTDAAMEALTAITASNPADVKAACLLAKLHLKQGDASKAAELFIIAITKQPASYSDIDSVFTNATPAQREKLLDVLGRLTGREADSAPANYLRGQLLVLSDRVEDASRAFAAAAKDAPDFGPASAAMVRVLFNQRKWESAIDAAKTAIKSDAAGAEVYRLKGAAHMALDEYEEAETALLESFRLNSKSAEPLYILSEAAERRGEKKRCEQIYKRIVDDVDPRHIASRERLVRLYLNTDRLDKAREYFSDFERFNQTGPAVERTRAMLGLVASNNPSGPARLEEYRSALQRIVEQYPGDAATRMDLAMSYLATSDIEQAMKHTDAALTVDPRDVRARELKAQLLARNLDFAGATAIVKDLLIDHPRDLNSQRKLLDWAICQTDWDEALRLLDALAARDDLKGSKDFLKRQRIDCLLSAERFDDAISEAKEWLSDAPGDAAHRDAYLYALRTSKKYDEAISSVTRWLAEDPTNVELRGQLVEELLAADRLVQAEQKILSWLANDSDDFVLNRMLLAVFWREKNWDSAVELAQTGAETTEHHEQYQNSLGLTYRFAHRFDEAVELYRARHKAAPSEQTLDDLIAIFIAAERYTEAEQTINQFFAAQKPGKRESAEQPLNPVTLIKMRQNLATIYEATDRLKAAVDQHEEAYKMAPGDPGLNNDLGYTLADAGWRIEEAERMIRFAVSERPRNSAYLDSLGWVLYKRGKVKEGSTYLERAIKHGDERDPVLHDHWADALYRLDDKAKAKEQWQKALELINSRDEFGGLPQDRKLKARLENKLKQLADDKPVAVADLAPVEAASQPAEKSKVAGAG